MLMELNVLLAINKISMGMCRRCEDSQSYLNYRLLFLLEGSASLEKNRFPDKDEHKERIFSLDAVN